MASPVESVGEVLADRLRSPLLGAYAITSFVYHWPAWAYFFESIPADQKAARLAPLLGTPSALLAPAALALVIVLAGPFLHWGIAWVVTWPKRQQLAIEADLQRDKLLGLKTAAQVERAAAAEALDTLHQQQREWDVNGELRDLAKKEGEEQLRRLTEANEAHRLMIEKAQVELGVLQAQLEELKTARSDALAQREAVLSQVENLRTRMEVVGGTMKLLFVGGPKNEDTARTLWIQAQNSFGVLAQAADDAAADTP